MADRVENDPAQATAADLNPHAQPPAVNSLRHAFASALLARNVLITDVAEWLGHRSINVTYGTYGHLIDSSMTRAVDVLNDEYADWRQAA